MVAVMRRNKIEFFDFMLQTYVSLCPNLRISMSQTVYNAAECGKIL